MSLFNIVCKSPSNIALVKYWGKKEHQIPANTSISFTLKHCHSITQLDVLDPKESSSKIDFIFEGKPKPEFNNKLEQFFTKAAIELPFLNAFHYKIQSQNSFPHSSGIASSASSMSALAYCIGMFALEQNALTTENFLNTVSSLARLGSGSACRSVFPKIASWGMHPNIDNSSDYWATPFIESHPIFNDYQDSILIVEQGQKKVSSSAGHGLLKDHPFAKARFETAQKNISNIIPILKAGDIQALTQLVESEALMLHALMMCSNPYYILMKANSLSIIELIWKIREDTKIPWMFTLDAGANVHLLYPNSVKNQAINLIENQLKPFCENGMWISDEIGEGTSLIKNHIFAEQNA